MFTIFRKGLVSALRRPVYPLMTALCQVLNKPDKALGILRTALKKDRSNARLYLHILDVCYQRNPVDVR